jgi:ribosomal protein S27AE
MTMRSVDEILAEGERYRKKVADEKRTEFFAKRQPIPDLYFETPQCPCCGLRTHMDDDRFSCQECEITWPRDGYGQDAFEWNEEPRDYEGGISTDSRGVENG